MPTLEATASPKYNLGTYLAYRLEEIGARDYFVVPGDFNLILLDQILKNDNLRMVGCCNELNAGYAADGYARTSSSKVAVVFVTFMVGGLSLLNAIAGAYSEGLRVIVVSGAPSSHTYGQDSLIHHTTGLKDQDQALRMFEQVTTASVRLQRGTDPSSILDQTLIQCLVDSLPVYIEIPSDMPEDLCYLPGPLPLPRPLMPVLNNLQDAFTLFSTYWQTTQNLMIIVVPFARNSLTRNTLISLIEKLGCPVFCQPDGKSLIPESHPQFQGTFWGMASDPACMQKVMESDLWVGIGTRWEQHNPPNVPITTSSILDVIESILQPNDTLIAEAGDSWFNSQTIHLPDGVDYQMQLIYGSIGWSLPATLGCQLALFQMTAQELSTMIRLRMKSVIFIFNNLGYRIESAIHDGPYNYPSNWNYSLLASSMRNISHSPGNGNKYLTEQEKKDQHNPALVSMRIKTQGDLLIAYERILSETEKLFLLECCIHPWDISEGLRRFGRQVGG
ncbi:pyruvate decarboxylase [Aspergillus sclerotioniger CBS 115572]|uniref:Pyruvate decarboxylase n=1 Tax=Aspergillus sclerotioniger CBS 115572 TaxID=1450535 RepID=A0A317VHU8_9EURO|nr:pyruvate decarboxylase [Aspergillus sclerotioniger CBS 115572]PWY72462.1 pyruvate decarboxylase [Aspergillus sclerotioniger CBS 115572]